MTLYKHTTNIATGESGYVALTQDEIDEIANRIAVALPLAEEDERVANVAISSMVAIENIPGWATWTEAEALAWATTNLVDQVTALAAVLPVANLTEANDALAEIYATLDKLVVAQQAQARMLIAIRNKLWPDLEGSQ